MNDIIISQPWGGLGDNLQYSTLPELFSKNGYNVYISINNKVRNQEIYDLVWGLNPYIKGISNEEANAGDPKNYLWPPAEQNEYMIHRVEISHGFEKTNFFPKIYYNPRNIPELNNDILIDLSGSSQIYDLIKYIEYIDYFTPLIINKNQNIKIIILEKHNISSFFDKVYQYLKSKIPDVGYLKVESLIHYCDVIKSCDTFIIVNSGCNSLASAIKQDDTKPLILCYNPWKHDDKGFYHYKNVKYFY